MSRTQALIFEYFETQAVGGLSHYLESVAYIPHTSETVI